MLKTNKSLTTSIIIRRSQSIKVSGSKTHPLILGQWVVYHKVLLACGLAGVGDVLWQKKNKNNNNARQLVTTFDDLISFFLMGCILCSMFQDITSYKLYIWMSSRVYGEHLYLRTILLSHGPQTGALTISLIFSYWSRSSFVLFIHCPLSSGRTSRYSYKHATHISAHATGVHLWEITSPFRTTL